MTALFAEFIQIDKLVFSQTKAFNRGSRLDLNIIEDKSWEVINPHKWFAEMNQSY